MLAQIGSAPFVQVVVGEKEVPHAIVALLQKAQIHLAPEIAAGARVRNGVASHVDVVGELSITVQHGLKQHLFLSGVHRAVGVDNGAQPVASPAHALELGHHPALLFQNKLDSALEHERPVVGAVVFHGQISRLERQRRRVRLGGVAPALPHA